MDIAAARVFSGRAGLAVVGVERGSGEMAAHLVLHVELRGTEVTARRETLRLGRVKGIGVLGRGGRITLTVVDFESFDRRFELVDFSLHPLDLFRGVRALLLELFLVLRVVVEPLLRLLVVDVGSSQPSLDVLKLGPQLDILACGERIVVVLEEFIKQLIE